MAVAGAVIAAVGLAVEIYGEVDAANSKANALEADAKSKRAQANELLTRQAINEGILRDQSQYTQRDYAASFAATGVEGGGIGGVLRIRKNLEESIANSRRDAEFKARMLRAGANVDANLASDAMTAGYLRGTGTALTGAAKAYDNYGGKQSPESLPGVSGNTKTGAAH